LETKNLLKSRQSSTKKLNKNSKLFKTVVKAILDKKGEDILSLDLRKIPESVSDFFIICSTNNSTQIKAIADNIENELLEVCNEKVFKKEGQHGGQWILLDYVNIVVHIMHHTTRQYYKIEDMWSDAEAEHHSI
jgi:ribosome-associated protein